MSRYPGGILSSSAPTVNPNTAKGIWTLDEAMRYSRAGQWPVPTGNGDPYFQYNSILLPGQGTNGAQNNTFLDSSTNNFTITRNGNTTQGTFTPFSQASGYWSMYNAAAGYQRWDTATNYSGTDLTLECWVYLNALPGSGTAFICSNLGWDNYVTYFSLGMDNNSVLSGGTSNGSTYTGLVDSVTFPLNQWTHVALVYSLSNTSLSLYKNGIRVANSTSAVSIGSVSTGIQVGGVVQTSGGGYYNYINGYISNARINKSAVYSGTSFSVPTSPLTADANTNLLVCQSNRLVDNSGNNYTTGVNTVSASAVPFEPFGAPTTAYSASTIGGSGYFDGTGDYLTSGSTTAFDSFCTGSATGITLTLEAFVYPTATVAGASPWQSAPIFAKGSTYFCFGIYNNKLRFYWFDGATQYVDSTATVPLNAWSQVSATVNGSSITLYVNGTSSGTGTFTGIQTAAQGTAENFGYQPSSATLFTGYISSVRISNNVRTISLQTAPFSNDANTKYLLNFTNGGIIDNAEKNDLETVGNAQISTSQYKWGASSMYFDGTGDYLYEPSNINFQFGTGDFTIEFWLYFNSTSGTQVIYDNRPANGAYPMIYAISGVLYYYTNTASQITGPTLSASTWYHIAVSRTGGSTKMFVNGNQVGSTYADTTNYLIAPLRVGSDFTPSAYLNGYVADLRVTKGYARYPYNFTAPTAALPLFYQAAATPSADPYFENTTLLLPGNGTNGANNNTFLDSSTNAFTITRNGNTTQGTFTPFSQTGWGNYFDGSSCISTADSADFTFGSSDFTIQGWLYSTVTGSLQWIAGQASSAASNSSCSFSISKTSGNKLSPYVFSGSTAYQITSNIDLPPNQWTHFAFVRDSNTCRLYINGVQDSTMDVTGVSVNDSSYQVSVGQLGEYVSNRYTGYVSNFSIIKGTCSYPNGTTFTVPTSPLSTSATNQSLLTCTANRFIDTNTATTAKTLTITGTPSVQAFSPFNPTAAYSTSTVGGSGYFDGSGDSISAPNSTDFDFGSGDFTLEFWYYPTAQGQSGYTALLSKFSSSANYAPFSIVQKPSSYDIALSSSSTGSSWNLSNGTTSNFGTMQANAWNHIAVAREGSNCRCFLNGVLNQTSNFSTTALMTNSDPVYIGSGNAANSYATGYIAGVRILKGSAQYTAAFTPPTLPPTAITNTKLLCNFTNGGITDATAKNDLETVGGASISTTVSKFGGSSMYFDGSGDYLIMPNVLTGQFGTGDFTIEYWDYHGTQGTNYSDQVGTLSSATPAGTWRFGTQANNGGLYFSYHNGSSYVDVQFGSAAYNDSTWRHFAISRYNGVLLAFVNGVQVGSSTACTQNFNSSNRVILGAELVNPTYFTGYLQDVRVTKGIARYTQNFTPPTTAFLTL